jgi:hypothetical protein
MAAKYTAPTFRRMGIGPDEQAEWAALGCTNVHTITMLRLAGVTPDLIMTRFRPELRASLLLHFKHNWTLSNCPRQNVDDAMAAIRRADGEHRVVSQSEQADALLRQVYGHEVEQEEWYGDEAPTRTARALPAAARALPVARA